MLSAQFWQTHSWQTWKKQSPLRRQQSEHEHRLKLNSIVLLVVLAARQWRQWQRRLGLCAPGERTGQQQHRHGQLGSTYGSVVNIHSSAVCHHSRLKYSFLTKSAFYWGFPPCALCSMGYGLVHSFVVFSFEQLVYFQQHFLFGISYVSLWWLLHNYLLSYSQF